MLQPIFLYYFKLAVKRLLFFFKIFVYAHFDRIFLNYFSKFHFWKKLSSIIFQPPGDSKIFNNSIPWLRNEAAIYIRAPFDRFAYFPVMQRACNSRWLVRAKNLSAESQCCINDPSRCYYSSAITS